MSTIDQNGFDSEYYLSQRPDVKQAGVNPYQHFLSNGWKEKANPNAFFNTAYYLTNNPDVVTASINPFTHFLSNGWKESRNPSSKFDISYYLQQNPDVATAGIDPLIHFLTNGYKEGRLPSSSFNSTLYLQLNPDVATAGINPLIHYTEYGAAENRPITDGSTTTDITSTSKLLPNAQNQSVTNTTINNTSLANSIFGALDSTYHWSKKTLSYGFNTFIPTEYTDSNDRAGWQPFNSRDITIAKEIFNHLQDITQLTFQQSNTTNSGDIRFNKVLMSSSNGWAYYPSSSATGGDVFVSTTYDANSGNEIGSYGYSTILHEIGHALGLKHPFEDGITLPSNLDDTVHTLMSYTAGKNTIPVFTTTNNQASVQISYTAELSTYALFDTAVLQKLYGANMNTNTDNNTYSVSSRQHEYKVIWDAGGTDTIDASQATGVCNINLKSGTFSSVDIYTLDMQAQDTIAMYQSQGLTGSNIVNWVNSIFSGNSSNLNTYLFYTGENNLAIGYGVVIENVSTGSANDTVIDNEVNNFINTGSGNDTITIGNGGFDTINGGSGTDTVKLSVAKTGIDIEKESDGSYLLVSSNFSARLIGIENLLFSDNSNMILA